MTKIERAKIELQMMKLEAGKREKEIVVLEREEDIDRIKKTIDDYKADINKIKDKLNTKE